ncbi:exosome complex component rrp45 [Chelonus insularis]|uniref:exosome complex component rrp45 n=1 Tax=Chelonus insularis TaxID=460826 RepID=UPI001589AA19|nr:exosome complex component rrp45 [Chelonus insularis]
MKEVLISKCERKFINTALLENIRLDGRSLLEARPVKLHFGSKWGCCLASLGQTKVLVNVSCDIQPPKLSRPNEGILYINVELNPLAAAHFEAGRQSDAGVLITRLLEMCFKDSRCIDLEALCIVADKKVWNIRVDVNIINHDGNLVDCACIATLAALSHFHRPDVTSTGDEIIIHTFSERDPLPLTLFHHPVCVSFTTFENGKTIKDPTYIEERLGVTQLTIGLNAYKEICCLHFDHTEKSGVSADIISSVVHDASNYAIELIKLIREAVKTDVEIRYKKELKAVCNFENIITTDKITTMMSERIHIKLSKWNVYSNGTKNEVKNEMKDDDESVTSNDEYVDMKEDVDDSKIYKIGKGSAALISQIGFSIGEGGKNTWNVSDTSGDEEMDEVQELKIVKKEPKIIDDIVLSDSEEEATGTLSKADLL